MPLSARDLERVRASLTKGDLPDRDGGDASDEVSPGPHSPASARLRPADSKPASPSVTDTVRESCRPPRETIYQRLRRAKPIEAEPSRAPEAFQAPETPEAPEEPTPSELDPIVALRMAALVHPEDPPKLFNSTPQPATVELVSLRKLTSSHSFGRRTFNVHRSDSRYLRRWIF